MTIQGDAVWYAWHIAIDGLRRLNPAERKDVTDAIVRDLLDLDLDAPAPTDPESGRAA